MNVLEESKHESRKAQAVAYQQLISPNRQMVNSRPHISLNQHQPPLRPIDPHSVDPLRESPVMQRFDPSISPDIRSSLCYTENSEEQTEYPSVGLSGGGEVATESPTRYPALVLRSVPPEMVNRAPMTAPPSLPSLSKESQMKKQFTQPTQLNQPTQLPPYSQAVQSVQSVQSVQPVQPVQPVRSMQPVKPVQLVQPASSASPVQPTLSTQPGRSMPSVQQRTPALPVNQVIEEEEQEEEQENEKCIIC